MVEIMRKAGKNVKIKTEQHNPAALRGRGRGRGITSSLFTFRLNLLNQGSPVAILYSALLHPLHRHRHGGIVHPSGPLPDLA
jgi:hypothetical protein